MKNYKGIILVLLLTMVSTDILAQSGIYVCGYFRRNRPYTVTKIKNSGYTNAILFNVDVQEDGTLTTDYNWSTQTPAEAGGIICKDGQYVFGQYQPNYANDVKSLLVAPTSVQRIEICIGGWGNGSYGKIKALIEKEGSSSTSMLYKNFKALKEAIPEIVAVNNDQEQDYDLTTALRFHRMMFDLGYNTTIAPYMNPSYWQSLVTGLNNSRNGACDLVYLQTYGGGAYNNPAATEWNFGSIPVWVGFDCESSGDLAGMETKFKNWKNTSKASGGFLWNYNSDARVVNDWATAINRIFSTRTVDENVVGAKVYSEANYGGYCVPLTEGKFTMADLAVFGLKARDLASLQVTDGYKVYLYKGTACIGTSLDLTASSTYVGDSWNNTVCSIKVENLTSGIQSVDTRQQVNEEYLYNIAGQRVDESFNGIVIKNGKKTININR